MQKLKNLDSLGNSKYFRIVEAANTRENGGGEAGELGKGQKMERLVCLPNVLGLSAGPQWTSKGKLSLNPHSDK